MQFRSGFVDHKHRYTAEQLRWKHDGGPWDVVAVKDAAAVAVAAAWTPKSGGY